MIGLVRRSLFGKHHMIYRPEHFSGRVLSTGLPQADHADHVSTW
jgi:hypothetical protein